ncbi:hypothetical protein HZB60_02345 [candidate division KSB1 bacterium]|nr:hypothetical protein [candidate division KSB1 bacterium]
MKAPTSLFRFAWLAAIAAGLQTAHAQPPGENCFSAPVIPAPFSFNGQTGATDDCPLGPRNDVFYMLHVPSTGNYTASLCGSPGDLSLRIWTNFTCCSGPSVTTDNTCGDDPSITVPLTIGALAYFEIGNTVAGGPAPFVFQLTGPPPAPCTGTLSIPVDQTVFPPTVLGITSHQVLMIENTGASDLCITEIRTNGSVWTVTPDSITLPASSQLGLDIAFTPAFAHDYLGTIELVTSDPANPLDSILVEGTGCRGVVQPGPPLLLDAYSPNAVYFRPPWVQANPDQEYAIEVWSPADPLEYANHPRGLADNPVWATSAQWGIGSAGVIEGLAPETDYQFRLIARDCTGQQLTSAPAYYTTGPEIVIANPDLVIKAVDDTTATLYWNPCRDTSGVVVTNYGYLLYSSDHPDSTEIPIEFVPLHLTSVNVQVGTPWKFYTIEPHSQNSWYGPRPFISWPPDGCTLAGEQDIILKDALHYTVEWDSFRIESDSAGFPVLLGSSWINNTDLLGELGTRVDFNDLGNGPHVITATVVDDSGYSHLSSVLVNVVDAPYATFTATYDPGPRQFRVTEAATVIPAGFAQTGTLWLCSHVGERYGPAITLNWEPAFDSLMIVKPLPQVNDGLLYEPNYWFRAADENGGLQPRSEQTPVTLTHIRCCCVELTLKTAGQADGSYSGFSGVLGAVVNCSARSNTFEVGFGFETKRKLRLEYSETPGECTWGQDAKGTRYFDTGVCKNNTCTIVKQDTITKKHKGVKYPFTDSTTDGFGNDGYGKKGVGKSDGRNRGPRDERGMPGRDKVKKTGKAEGTITSYDWPGDTGKLLNKQCARDNAQNRFFSRVDPPCDAGLPCCLMWDISWDVTFCMGQNSCTITQTVPPTLTMVPTPEGCPALAGD